VFSRVDQQLLSSRFINSAGLCHGGKNNHQEPQVKHCTIELIVTVSRLMPMFVSAGLFCTSLKNACTLRGRLVCRLRHVVQQLMQEHIAQELLGNFESVNTPPVNSRGSKAATKSAKKKKSSGTRGISGVPENKVANKQERSNQSKGEVTSKLAPRVASPVAETNGVLQASLAARDKQVVADPESQMPPSLFGGEAAAGTTTPSTRAVENLNETDEEERCSSSGEAWEEVGAAKRRKERRRRAEDKVCRKAVRFLVNDNWC
jgi:hypothetical protein